MKKTIILVIAISFITSYSMAQEPQADNREMLQFGLKAGVNLSNVYNTESENFETDPKLGFVGGAFLVIPIGRYLGVQPEILYSQKGFRATGESLGIVDYEVTRTTSFIDVPLLVAFKPTRNVTLLAGPQFSFLLKQRDEFENSLWSDVQEEEFANDNLRKNVLCFTGGVDLSMNHLVLSARLGWDLQNNNGDGTSTNPKYKNIWGQATIGFKF